MKANLLKGWVTLYHFVPRFACAESGNTDPVLSNETFASCLCLFYVRIIVQQKESEPFNSIFWLTMRHMYSMFHKNPTTLIMGKCQLLLTNRTRLCEVFTMVPQGWRKVMVKMPLIPHPITVWNTLEHKHSWKPYFRRNEKMKMWTSSSQIVNKKGF